MEAQQGQSGGGEVRRVHIIYFLSRKGRIEHPHLIRVHHLSRNGVRLRDVKRWLSELRGKDMPESFAWSYKRRYKAGYVWQDLLDEDLITPISDNEYVIKGSEIVSTTFGNDLHTYGEKKMSTDHQEHPPLENIEIESKDQKVSSKEAIQEQPKTKIGIMAKTSCEIEEESPPFSSDTSTTLTDDSMKLEEEKFLDTSKQGTSEQSDKLENNSTDYFYSNLLNNNNINNDNDNNKSKNKTSSGTTPRSSTSSRSSFTRSKSYSSGASNMFRSLITCGTVDTNDSAMVMINRRDKSGASNGCTNGINDGTAEQCKGEKLGGSQRIFGTTLNQHHQDNGARKSYDGAKGAKKKRNKSGFSNQGPLSAAYKPVNGPNCSQCGKMFKPEKLHSHMKSCRGMKALAKGTSPAASVKAQSHGSSMDDSSFQQSASGYYLTHYN